MRYAREDLYAGGMLVRDPSVAPRQVCWLVQQAAEKALKAALCFLEIEFPRTHNLDSLRNLLPRGWAAREQTGDLAELLGLGTRPSGEHRSRPVLRACAEA